MAAGRASQRIGVDGPLRACSRVHWPPPHRISLRLTRATCVPRAVPVDSHSRNQRLPTTRGHPLNRRRDGQDDVTKENLHGCEPGLPVELRICSALAPYRPEGARRRPARLTGAVRRRPTRRRPSLRRARAVAPVRRTPSRGRPRDDVAQTAARPGYSGCASLLEACRARPREAPRTHGRIASSRV